MNRKDTLHAVDILASMDHQFISKEAVDKICKAFDYKTKCYPGHSDPPGTLKGLTMAPGKEGALGKDARDLAEELCGHLSLSYPDMFGRGSGLRVCCEALREYVNKKYPARPNKRAVKKSK